MKGMVWHLVTSLTNWGRGVTLKGGHALLGNFIELNGFEVSYCAPFAW